jgi:hypothetical protein
VNISLQLEVERLDDGTWMVDAVWLSEAIHGETFEECYWEAVKRWKIRQGE